MTIQEWYAEKVADGVEVLLGGLAAAGEELRVAQAWIGFRYSVQSPKLPPPEARLHRELWMALWETQHPTTWTQFE